MLYQRYSNLILLSPPVLPIRYPFSYSLHSFLSNTLILPNFPNGITFSHTRHSTFSPKTYLLPTLFYLLIKNTCISLFSPKKFYQIHSSLLTISLSPSTNCPSHPILSFSFLSFHPSFIFYSLVLLLSLL